MSRRGRRLPLGWLRAGERRLACSRQARRPRYNESLGVMRNLQARRPRYNGWVARIVGGSLGARISAFRFPAIRELSAPNPSVPAKLHHAMRCAMQDDVFCAGCIDWVLLSVRPLDLPCD